MKTTTKLLPAGAALAVFLLPVAYGQPGKAQGPIDVLAMKSVPDGHYLLNLQSGGRERLVNLQVKGQSARSVNSSDPLLSGLEGKFQLIGNGVFQISLQNVNHKATQLWLFRKDGSATVREVPDRGEKQRAISVPDASLERPKESPPGKSP